MFSAPLESDLPGGFVLVYQVHIRHIACAKDQHWGCGGDFFVKYIHVPGWPKLVEEEQAPAVLPGKEAVPSQDEQPWCCRESRGWGGCRQVRSLGREAAESWSLLAVSASMCGEVGVWHRAGKANQLINSMRKQQE